MLKAIQFTKNLRVITSKIGYVFSRGKRNFKVQEQPDLSIPHYLTSLDLTLSAIMEIQTSKDTPNLQIPFEKAGWHITKTGRQVSMHNKLYNRDVYVVFRARDYPTKDKEKQPKEKQGEDQEEDQSIFESQDAEQSPSESLLFQVYIKQTSSPVFLVVKCFTSDQGVVPYSVSFTSNYQDHKIGRQKPTWNQLDDLSESTLHFIKRVLQNLTINQKFGALLEQYDKYCLKENYLEWVNDLRNFLRK